VPIDQDIRTPLHTAGARGGFRFISHSCLTDVMICSDTFFPDSSLSGSCGCIDVLLRRLPMLDINAQDFQGRSALHLAVEAEREGAVQALVDWCADKRVVLIKHGRLNVRVCHASTRRIGCCGVVLCLAVLTALFFLYWALFCR
jgi:hypothetical protein